jgi:hypothetical protein
MKLLTVGQYKLDKSKDEGYLTGGCNLSPSTESVEFGGINLCPNSGDCAESCLKFAGYNTMTTHKPARVERSVTLVQHLPAFRHLLEKELDAFMRKAIRDGLIPCGRPNLLSDWYKLALMFAEFEPDLQLYDYTKLARPWERVTDKYHLTYSLDTHNEREAIDAQRHGVNVAVVFNPRHPIPESFVLGGVEYPTLDGDKHDLRFLDPPGHIVALKGKRIAGGMERAIESGFYRTVEANR